VKIYNYLSFLISLKVKEVHFKTMNEIYPCNYLHKRFNMDVNVVLSVILTLKRQNISSSVTQTFWDAFQFWICKLHKIFQF